MCIRDRDNGGSWHINGKISRRYWKNSTKQIVTLNIIYKHYNNYLLMSAEKNLNNKKTSFLSKNNSSFIENMYLRYIDKDPSLPDSWNTYFSDLNEDLSLITKEIEGPSWRKKKISQSFENNDLKILEQQKIDSIKAIALIRSYRIRGHLIANLDPLGMMKREYLHELHPSDHGFKREDYDRKIYLSSYLDLSLIHI